MASYMLLCRVYQIPETSLACYQTPTTTRSPILCIKRFWTNNRLKTFKPFLTSRYPATSVDEQLPSTFINTIAMYKFRVVYSSILNAKAILDSSRDESRCAPPKEEMQFCICCGIQIKCSISQGRRALLCRPLMQFFSLHSLTHPMIAIIKWDVRMIGEIFARMPVNVSISFHIRISSTRFYS